MKELVQKGIWVNRGRKPDLTKVKDLMYRKKKTQFADIKEKKDEPRN